MSEVGPEDSPLAGLSASRRRRLDSRVQQNRASSAKRIKLQTEELQRKEIPLPQATAPATSVKKRGTRLVPHQLFSRFKKHAGSLATHGCGVSVEVAPRVGLALKAKKAFSKGDLISQYEGEMLTWEESLVLPEDSSRSHLFGMA